MRQAPVSIRYRPTAFHLHEVFSCKSVHLSLSINLRSFLSMTLTCGVAWCLGSQGAVDRRQWWRNSASYIAPGRWATYATHPPPCQHDAAAMSLEACKFSRRILLQRDVRLLYSDALSPPQTTCLPAGQLVVSQEVSRLASECMGAVSLNHTSKQEGSY